MSFGTISKLHNVNAWLTSSPKLVWQESWTQKRVASSRIRTAAVSSSGSEVAEGFEEGQLERPKWTGETPLSRLVAALISFKPLYSVLKYGARQVIISTAEKSNIPWRDMTQEILESDVYKEKDAIEDPSVVYPDCNFLNLYFILASSFVHALYFVNLDSFIGVYVEGGKFGLNTDLGFPLQLYDLNSANV